MASNHTILITGVIGNEGGAVAPTNFISLTGINPAVSWQTGFSPNVRSRLSSAAERFDS